jgi:outer membrane protein assembly factor BamB
VGNHNDKIFAFDVETGDKLWDYRTGFYIKSSPTVVDDTVFIGSDDGSLIALNTEDGTERWVFSNAADFGPGSEIESSPTVSDGTVFVGSTNSTFYAVDAESGEEVWTFETNDGIQSSPTTVGNTVFVGSNDNNLYALDADTGTEQWVFETDGEIYSSPTVVDGTIFVGSGDGNLYAITTTNEDSSDGSRTTLGTLGHLANWEYADQELDIQLPEEQSNTEQTGEQDAQDQSSESQNDETLPWLGIGGAVATLGGAGYMINRRRHSED